VRGRIKGYHNALDATMLRPPGHVSLERALSKLGLASRSRARGLILEGRVTVDGQIERHPGRPVVPESVRIEIDGAPQATPRPALVMMHKPRGVVTTANDPQGRPTVMQLVADAPPGLQPIGRLDAATSGLLLLTNVSRWVDDFTAPDRHVPKRYIVSVLGRADDALMGKIMAGVVDNGEHLAASDARVLRLFERTSDLGITLTEGKNRHIRRMLAALGFEVTALQRFAIGGLELGTLPPGRWHSLSRREALLAYPDGRFDQLAE